MQNPVFPSNAHTSMHGRIDGQPDLIDANHRSHSQPERALLGFGNRPAYRYRLISPTHFDMDGGRVRVLCLHRNRDERWQRR
jgi:hypothetical protein